MPTRGEIVFDSVLDRPEPQLLVASARVVRERFVLQVDERESSPQSERFFAPALLGEPLELEGIELTSLDSEDVTRIAREEAAVTEVRLRCETALWRIFDAVAGGRPSQRTSISRPLGTTSLAWRRR